MIPNIIHQIWIQGVDKMPAERVVSHNDCKRINDNFRHKFWDDDKIKKLLLKHFGQEYVDVYNSYDLYSQKADFARYAIVYVYGGIYLDMDVVCKKNLLPFLNYNFFLTSGIFPHFFKKFGLTVFGARPKHPIFEIVFKKLFERRGKVKSVLDSTATGLFYDSVIEYVKEHPEDPVMYIDPKYLDPCSGWNVDKCEDDCTDCYTVHMADLSWSPTLRFCKYLLKHKYIVIFILIVIIVVLLILVGIIKI